MLFMNQWDIEVALTAFLDPRGVTEGETPNLAQLAAVVNNLSDWANDNSDGWAHWPKPCRAAKRAQEILTEALRKRGYRQDVEDITVADLKAACRPIKAFLTRQGVDHGDVFIGELGAI